MGNLVTGAAVVSAILDEGTGEIKGFRGRGGRDQLLNSSVTRYPGFFERRPLAHEIMPIGTAAINEGYSTGGTVVRSDDATALFNGRTATKAVVSGAMSTTDVTIGATATITLDTTAQEILSSNFIIPIKWEGLGTLSGAVLYFGDSGLTNFITVSLVPIGVTADGWTLLSKVSFGSTSTTGSGANLANPVRTRLMVRFGANVVAGTIWFGRQYVMPAPQPTVLVTLDDGWKEQGWVAEEAAKRGIPLQIGIAKELATSGQAQYLSESDIRGLNEHPSGLIGLYNHSTNNDAYSSIGLAAYVDNLLTNRRWMESLGVSHQHASLTTFVQGSHDTALDAAIAEEGFLAAREVGASNRRGLTQLISPVGASSPLLYQLPATVNLGNAQNLSTVQGYITTAAEQGTAVIMGHKFRTTAEDVNTWIAGYDADYGILNLLDWLADRRDVDGWRILKWSEWYDQTLSGAHSSFTM